MLERTDRLALAIRDADEACSSFAAIFDTRTIADERDEIANARRVTLQFGRNQIELYEPTGDGAAAGFLDARRSGLFAGGFACASPETVAAQLEAAGVRVHEQGDGRFVVLPDDLDGTGVILSKREDHDPVGLADKIWQITYAVPSLDKAVDRYSALFGLGDMFTNVYESAEFGYLGAITWFDARNGAPLDSLEYLEPKDPSKAVARFIDRNGNGIYMASIETDHLPEIRERVTSTGPGWTPAGVGGFIHPRQLHGLLVFLVSYTDWNAHRALPPA